MRNAFALTITAVVLAAAVAVADTVYKSVDDKGNIIYSQNPPPKSKDAKIRSTTELSIDPNRNIVPAPRPLNPRSLGDDGQVTQVGSPDEVAEAQAALDEAEAQLKASNEVQPGDFSGKAGGGVGPSQQRLQRLEEAQRAVNQAREKLERLQGGGGQIGE